MFMIPSTIVLPTRTEWFDIGLQRFVVQDLPTISMTAQGWPIRRYHAFFGEHFLVEIVTWPIQFESLAVELHMRRKTICETVDRKTLYFNGLNLGECFFDWFGYIWPNIELPSFFDILNGPSLEAIIDMELRIAEQPDRGDMPADETSSKDTLTHRPLLKLPWHPTAIEMYRQGYTYREIGEHIKQAQKTVQNYIGDIRKVRPDLAPRRQNPKRKQSQGT